MLRVLSSCRAMSSSGATASLLGREIYQNNTVVRLILQDAKRRNALSLAMIDQLHKELADISKISKVRSVIIAADGPSFSSGHDLKELKADQGSEKHLAVFERCALLCQLIQSMRQPVIAEVGGVAAAAGCQLVASCDIVVASEKATFLVPGQRVGLFCSTPSVPLSRCVPSKIALDMLLTAQPINAHAAQRAGLVSRVAAAGEERVESLRVAEQIGAFSSEVTALGKAFFYSQLGLPSNNAFRIGSRVMTENLKLTDAQEGIEAFLGKRKPTFTL